MRSSRVLLSLRAAGLPRRNWGVDCGRVSRLGRGINNALGVDVELGGAPSRGISVYRRSMLTRVPHGAPARMEARHFRVRGEFGGDPGLFTGLGPGFPRACQAPPQQRAGEQGEEKRVRGCDAQRLLAQPGI